MKLMTRQDRLNSGFGKVGQQSGRGSLGLDFVLYGLLGVKVSNFIPGQETHTDRFMAHGIRLKDQNFIWFTQHGDK